jgi:hypothetical protein
MGAWGAGSFENDDALDWASELAGSSGVAAVEDALDLSATSAEYLEAPECSIGLAAAETVAAMNGKPAADLPDEVAAFARAAGRPTGSLVDAASSAVARVLEKSELRELWEESESYDDWRARLIDLQQRLRGG